MDLAGARCGVLQPVQTAAPRRTSAPGMGLRLRAPLRRARHSRHGDRPKPAGEYMHTSISATVHLTPIITNHELELATTKPSGISPSVAPSAGQGLARARMAGL
jgi:hypothetical protein